METKDLTDEELGTKLRSLYVEAVNRGYTVSVGSTSTYGKRDIYIYKTSTKNI